MREYIEVVEIKVEATPGSHVSKSIEDAIALSCNEKRNVSLKHNGMIFTVNYSDIFKTVEDSEKTSGSL